MKRSRNATPLLLLVGGCLGLTMPARVLAHCDGMDGPVVQAAQRAIATRDVSGVLGWVLPADEAQIRKIFAATLNVRGLNPEARELADMHFFETLVRLHRAGEGEPYTGLKPAGRDPGPAVRAADTAVENGAVEPLVNLLTGEAANGIRERFKKVMAAKKTNMADVSSHREYVKAYVAFVHYVDALHTSLQGSAHEGGAEGAESHSDG